MLWIINEKFSQDWGGDLTSILCVDKEHQHYGIFNEIFRDEFGEVANGYVILEYVKEEKSGRLVVGTNNPPNDLYESIIEQISWKGNPKVIDIRGHNVVGIA